MHDPWDAEAGDFHVLVNAAGQMSLWPVHLPVPAGWTVAAAARSRQACLEWIEAHAAATDANMVGR